MADNSFDVIVRGASGKVYHVDAKSFSQDYDKYVANSSGAKVQMYDMNGKEHSVDIAQAKTMYGKGYSYTPNQHNYHAGKIRHQQAQQAKKSEEEPKAQSVTEQAKAVATKPKAVAVSTQKAQGALQSATSSRNTEQPDWSVLENTKKNWENMLNSGAGDTWNPDATLNPTKGKLNNGSFDASQNQSPVAPKQKKSSIASAPSRGSRMITKDEKGNIVQRSRYVEGQKADEGTKSTLKGIEAQSNQFADEISNSINAYIEGQKEQHRKNDMGFLNTGGGQGNADFGDDTNAKLSAQRYQMQSPSALFGEWTKDDNGNRVWKEGSLSKKGGAVDQLLASAMYESDGKGGARIKKSIERDAYGKGMSVSGYVSGILVPKIQEQLMNRLNQNEVVRNMPKDNWDYFLKSMRDSALGMLLNAQKTSLQERQVQQQAMHDYEEQTDMGIGGHALHAIGTTVGDLPLMMIGGWIGKGAQMAGGTVAREIGKSAIGATMKEGLTNNVVTRALATYTPKLAKAMTPIVDKLSPELASRYEKFVIANVSKPQWYGREIAKGVLAQPANMGFFMGAKGAEETAYYSGSDTSGAALYDAFMNGAGHGMVMGETLNLTAPFAKYFGMTGKTPLGRFAVNTLGKFGEANTFVALDYIDAKMQGRDDFSYTADLAQNIGMILGMSAATHPASAMGSVLKGVRKAFWYKTDKKTINPKNGQVEYHYAFNPVKAWKQLMTNDNNIKDLALSKECKEHLKKAFPNDPFFDESYLMGKDKGENWINALKSGDPVAIATARDYDNKLSQLLQDKYDVSWKDRNEISAKMYGIGEGSRPLFDHFDIKGGEVQMRASDGELIEQRTFENKDERDAYIANEMTASIYSKAKDLMIQFSTTESDEDSMMLNSLLKQYCLFGVGTEDEYEQFMKDSVELMDKDPRKMNDDERKQLQFLYTGLRNAAWAHNQMKGLLSPESAEVMGNADAKEADLAGENPNPDVATALKNDIADRIKEFDEATRIVNEVNANGGYGIDINKITMQELYEYGMPAEEKQKFLDYISAYNRYINAQVRYDAFIKATGDKINEHLDDWYDQVYFGGTGSKYSDDDAYSDYGVVIVTDGEKQYYLRDGDIRDGVITSISGMVGVVDRETGETDWVDPSKLTFDHEEDKETHVSGLREFMQQQISDQYHLADVPQQAAEETAETAEAAAEQPQIESEEPSAPQGEAPQEPQEPQEDGIPRHEDGTPIYEQLEPKQTIDLLNQLYGNDADMVGMHVANEVAKGASDATAQQKKLDKLTEKLKNGTPINMADVKELKDSVAEAAARGQYWQGVKDMLETEALAPTNTEGNATIDDAQAFEQNKQTYQQNRTVGAQDFTYVKGKKIYGHYVLGETGDTMPSHDPFNNYRQYPGVPRQANGRTNNDRDYEHDMDAQRENAERAQKYHLPNDIPVVSKDEGVVLSGNDRTMAHMLAVKNGKADLYESELKEKIGKFGFTEEDLAKYEHPEVRFELDEEVPYTTDTYSMFNAQDMKSMNSTEASVKNAKLLKENPKAVDAVMRILREHDDLTDFYKDKESQSGIVDTLVKAGVWTKEEVLAYQDNKGNLTRRGKLEFENVVRGLAFSEDAIRILDGEEMAAINNAVVKAIPSLVENNSFGEYSIMRVMEGAVKTVSNAIDNKYYKDGNIFKYFNQMELFREGDVTKEFLRKNEDGSDVYNDEEKALGVVISHVLARTKNERSVKFLVDFLDSYNKLAKNELDNKGSNMFGIEPMKAEEVSKAFRDAKLHEQITVKDKNGNETTKPRFSDDEINGIEKSIKALLGITSPEGGAEEGLQLPEGYAITPEGKLKGRYGEYFIDDFRYEKEDGTLSDAEETIEDIIKQEEEIRSVFGDKLPEGIRFVKQEEYLTEDFDSRIGFKFEKEGVDGNVFYDITNDKFTVWNKDGGRIGEDEKFESLEDAFKYLEKPRTEGDKEEALLTEEDIRKYGGDDDDLIDDAIDYINGKRNNFTKAAYLEIKAKYDKANSDLETKKKQWEQNGYDDLKDTFSDKSIVPTTEFGWDECFHETERNIKQAKGQHDEEQLAYSQGQLRALKEEYEAWKNQKFADDVAKAKDYLSTTRANDVVKALQNKFGWTSEYANKVWREAIKDNGTAQPSQPSAPTEPQGNGTTAPSGGTKPKPTRSKEQDAAADEFSAALDGFLEKNTKLLSVVDHLDDDTSRAKFRAVVKAATKLGYHMVKDGLRDADDWKKDFSERFGDKAMQALDMTKREWNEFLDDIWNNKQFRDGEKGRYTLAEWAKYYEENGEDSTGETVPTEGAEDEVHGNNEGEQGPAGEQPGDNDGHPDAGTEGEHGTENGTTGGFGEYPADDVDPSDIPDTGGNSGNGGVGTDGHGGGTRGGSHVGGSSSGNDSPKPGSEGTSTTGGAETPRPDAGYDGSAGTTGGEGGNKPLNTETTLDSEKVDYAPHSKGKSLHSVVPAGFNDAMKKNLDEIGDVDEYVRKALGYKDNDEMFKALAAEQIDGVALALKSMRQGYGAIIADQTGLGKGRQAASIIRYGMRNGLKPVFFTEKPSLFTAFYGDMVDIGYGDKKPFIIASDKEKGEIGYEGKVITLPTDEEYQEFMQTGKIPDGYDYAVVTYTQIQTNGEEATGETHGGTKEVEKDLLLEGRRKAVADMCRNNVVVFDEAHNAAGQSSTGRYCQQLVRDARGVTFFSATYAKRPDNMVIYALRSVLSDANVTEDQLIKAIQKGGPVYQEILSRALAESGALVRRERDMRGVTIDYEKSSIGESEQRETYDKAIRQFREISEYQKGLRDIAKRVAEQFPDPITGKPGRVKMTSNRSRLFNFTNQMFMGLKVEDAIRKAVEILNKEEEIEVNGEKKKTKCKVFIPCFNTNENVLSDFFEVGKEIDKNDLSKMLERCLDKCMIVKINGIPIDLRAYMEPEELDDYNRIKDDIESMEIGLALSPIDALMEGIRKAGFKVGEITGRGSKVVYGEDGKLTLEKRKVPDPNDVVNDYNNGALDVVIVNSSGSTGLSMHSSEKFKDQRKRYCVTLQAQLDVNTETQIRGRVDRTGQVCHAAYNYLVSHIPAEARVMMMLKTKLKSLDAQTTASQKSEFNEMETQDFANKYGSRVIVDILKEDPRWAELLDDPFGWKHAKNKDEDTAREEYVAKDNDYDKVMKRIAMLDTADQEELYELINDRYASLIEQLNATGMNDLVINNLPLEADVKNTGVVITGEVPGGNNVFADNTYVDEVEANNLDKPYTRQELERALKKSLDGRTAEEISKNTMDEIDAWGDAEKEKARKAAEDRFDNRMKRFIEKQKTRQKKATEAGKPIPQAEIDKAIADEEDFQKKKRDETISEAETKVAIKTGTFREALRKFKIGQFIKTDRSAGNGGYIGVSGVVLGYDISKGKNPSTSFILVASNRGQKVVKISFGDAFAAAHVTAGFYQDPVAEWDTIATHGKDKELRYIYTGNLLGALVQNRKGQIVNYTTNDGEVLQGMLLPKGTKLSDIGRRRPLIEAYDKVKDFVYNGRGELITSDKRFTIKYNTRDKTLTLSFANNSKTQEIMKDRGLAEVCGWIFDRDKKDGFFDLKSGGKVAYKEIMGSNRIKPLLQYLTDHYKAEFDDAIDFNVQAAEANLQGVPMGNAFSAKSFKGFYDQLTSDKGDKEYDPEIKALANDVFAVAEKLGVKMSLGRTGRKEKLGSYNPNKNEIRYKYNHIMYGDKWDAAETILHEVIHTVTSYAFYARQKGKPMSKELAEAVDEIIEIQQLIKKDPEYSRLIALEGQFTTQWYGTWDYDGKNPGHENVAEMSNPIWREKLKSIHLWDRFKNAVGKVIRALWTDLGLPTKDKTAFERMDAALHKMLDNFDIDLFHEEMGSNDFNGEEGTLMKMLDPKDKKEKAKIDELDRDEKVTGYRNVVLRPDGTFGSPMASGLRTKGQKKATTAGFEMGKWEMAEENPHLANDKGKIDLVKPDGKSVAGVDYNPYIHNRPNKVNKQFKQAWERPDLVYIQTEIPKGDLESGYHAEKAAKSVGIHNWPTETSEQRLILSRYDKPVRIVPWEEVADDWEKEFKGRGVEFDIVPPRLLPILAERGVKILPPHKGMGEACNKAYKEWKADFADNYRRYSDGERPRESENMLNNPLRREKSDDLIVNLQKNIIGKDYDRIEEVARRILDGRIKVVSPSEGETGEYASLPHAILSTFLRGSNKAFEDAAGRERTLQEEERIAEKFAKDTNNWINEKNYVKEHNLEEIPGGIESRVYLTPDGNIVKFTKYQTHDLGKQHVNTISEYLDNLALYNSLFINSQYKVLGLTRDSEGRMRVAVEQHYCGKRELQTAVAQQMFGKDYYDIGIDNRAKVRAKAENLIGSYMKNILGLSRVGNTAEYSNGYVTAEDLHGANFVVEDGYNLKGTHEDLYHLTVVDSNVRWNANHYGRDYELKSNDTLYRLSDHSDEKVRTWQESEQARTFAENAIKEVRGTGTVFASHDDLQGNSPAVREGRKVLKRQKNAAGWYVPETGEVCIYLPNCHSNYEIQKTVNHELVGHKGIRAVLGDKLFNKFVDKIWLGIDKPLRNEIISQIHEYGYNERTAIDEMLAKKAEDFTDSGHSFWQTVKNVFNSIFNVNMSEKDVRMALWLSRHHPDNILGNLQYKIEKAAFKFKLDHYTPKDRTIEGGVAYEGMKTVLDQELPKYLFSQRMTNAHREQFLDGLPPEGRLVADYYDNELKKWWYPWTEAWRNNMKSAEIMLEAITGKKMIDIESKYNVVDNLNQLSSKNDQAMQKLIREHIAPLQEKLLEIITDFDGDTPQERYANAEKTYFYAKHALEANRVYAVRDYVKDGIEKRAQFDQYLTDYQKTYDKYDKKFSNGDISEDEFDNAVTNFINGKAMSLLGKKVYSEYIKERDAAHKEYKHNNISIDNYFDRCNQAIESRMPSKDIDKFQGKFDDMRRQLKDDLDNGTITLKDYYDQLDHFIRSEIQDFDPSTHDMGGLSDYDTFPQWADKDVRGMYNDEAVINHIMDCEARMGKDKADAIWQGINNLSQSIIDGELNSGVLMPKVHERMSTMFSWYLPLRGFDAKTAEEQYGYIDGAKIGVGPSAFSAKGRTVAADRPVETLFHLASSSLMRGNRNIAKMAIQRLVADYKEQNLLTPFEAVYRVETDSMGDTKLYPEYPEIKEGATPKEIQTALETFEADIEARKAAGEKLVTLRDMKTGTAYRIERNRDKEQHFIHVMVNGKDTAYIINANPRAAQAINGMIHDINVPIWDGINRFMSQMNTSYSMTFMAANAIRDWEYAALTSIASENKDWNNNFHKMYRMMQKNNATGAFQGDNSMSMRHLFKMYRENKLDESNQVQKWFKEFVDNGGVTGYVDPKDKNDFSKEMDDLIASKFKTDAITTRTWKQSKKLFMKYGKLVDSFNEGVENHARFAAFCASRMGDRSISRSVHDAKEISINFNRTGAGYSTHKLHTPNETGRRRANVWAASLSAAWFRHASWFCNAGIQAMSRTFDLWCNGNKKQKAYLVGGLCLAPAVAQCIVSAINYYATQMFDDDDDKKKYGDDPYAQLPPYMRRNNMCIYMGHGRWAMIPLAVELRAFYGLMDMGIRAGKGIKENQNALFETLQQFSQLSPVDVLAGSKVGSDDLAGSLWGAVTPDNIEGGIAYFSNVGWTGRRIWNENEHEENKAGWAKAPASTNQGFVRIAKALNEWSGAGKYNDQYGDIQGKINLNPARIQYVLESYLGGPGKEFSNLMSLGALLTDKISGNEPDWQNTNIPVLKAIYHQQSTSISRSTDKSRWYEYKKEATNMTKSSLSDMRKHGNAIGYVKLYNSKEGKIMDVVDNYNKVIKALQTQKIAAETPSQRNYYDNLINYYISQAVGEIDKIEDQ